MAILNLFITTLLFSASAHTMCTSYRYRPIMWNPAGTHAVIVKQGFGPEGGGSIDLALVSPSIDPVRALITSNMSPGDGSTPENVPMKTCSQSIKDLNHNLVVHGFQNFLHESTCKPERTYLFMRKLDSTNPVDDNKKAELIKKADLKKGVLVYTANQNSFIVVDVEASCKAECFWLAFDTTKNVYHKKGACLPSTP